MELIIKCTYSRRYIQILLICDEIQEKFGVFFCFTETIYKKRYVVIEKHDEKKENNNARAL